MITNFANAVATRIAVVVFVSSGFGIVSEEQEWFEFHAIAMAEYVEEFDALFNSYETKWSKNNRLMIRVGETGSFKFAKKG